MPRGPVSNGPPRRQGSGATSECTTLPHCRKAAPSFLRSVDHILPVWKCGVVAATEMAEVGRLGFRQEDSVLLELISDVGGRVKQNFAELIGVCWVQSSGWYFDASMSFK